MGFKFVVLWTDAALWLLYASLAFYVLRVLRSQPLRATWSKVVRDAAPLCSLLVLGVFLAITALDSVHFRRALPPAVGQADDRVFYESRAESLLDLALARQLAMRESSYSEPLAYLAVSYTHLTLPTKTIVRTIAKSWPPIASMTKAPRPVSYTHLTLPTKRIV